MRRRADEPGQARPAEPELEQLEQRLREVRAKTIKRKDLALLKGGQELVPPCGVERPRR